MNNVLLVLVGLLISSLSYAEEIIDIPSIVGKSKSEVSSLLGKPLSCSASKHGEKCQFETAETEIVFINGKADWITVEGLGSYPFVNETLKNLGLRPSKPNFSNGFTKRWESQQGLLSISLFKAGNNADYAYIKAYTK